MKETQRIVAAMIAGGAALDADHLRKCLQSVSPYVDAIRIAYNGTGGFPLGEGELVDNKAEFQVFKWEDDFALARNQSFEMALKEDPDWILWIDADDVLVDGDKLRPMLDSLTDDVVGVFLRYDYLVNERGEAVIHQWRERIMSTKTDWRWKWPIHEVCHSRPGEHYSRRDDLRIAHQREPSETASATTRARNRKLLVKAVTEFPDEPRFLYYMANESLAAAQNMEPSIEQEEMLKAAIDHYRKFIDTATWNDDAYLANCNLAECYRLLGDYNRAMDIDLQSFKLYNTWPHAYIGIANSALKLGDPERAGWWAKLCLDHCETPQTTQVFEPRLLTFHPHLILGIAAEERGEFTEALDEYRTALKADPDNQPVLKKISQMELTVAHKDRVAKGSEAFDSGGTMWKSDRKARYSSKPERSIAFMTAPLFEPWQPSLEREGGIGGSETCVMRLASRFAADGWRTVVFGTPAEPGIDDGVEYYPVGDWDPNERFRVAVASRAPEFFDARVNADLKLLWMHDVNVGKELTGGEWGARLDSIDRIVSLTEWHRTHLMRLYGLPEEKLWRIPNGISIENYPADKVLTERPMKFLWSSSPDRGLDVVLGMWKKIRGMDPDAELHVYYGWTAIDKIIARSTEKRPHLAMFKADIETMLDEIGREEGGVFWHDRVPQHELAKRQMEARYWIYPTYFCETFCISAIEMQAAGVVPLTSNLGALQETVLTPALRIDGHPTNRSFTEEFLRMIHQVEELGELGREEYRTIGRNFAATFSWENVYTVWAKRIHDLLEVKA